MHRVLFSIVFQNWNSYAETRVIYFFIYTSLVWSLDRLNETPLWIVTKWSLFFNIFLLRFTHVFHLCLFAWMTLVKIVINGTYDDIIWTFQPLNFSVRRRIFENKYMYKLTLEYLRVREKYFSIYLFIFQSMCLCLTIYIYIYIYVCVCVCVCVFVCVCVCLCVCVGVCGMCVCAMSLDFLLIESCV